MPVGQHIANTPGMDNAYRVLDSDGKPRPDFHWDDPADSRDPIEVLKADGVRFTGGGADPSRRIVGVELAALIEILDEDAIRPYKVTCRAPLRVLVAALVRQSHEWDPQPWRGRASSSLPTPNWKAHRHRGAVPQPARERGRRLRPSGMASRPLLGALEIAAGQVNRTCYLWHGHQEFLRLLKKAAADGRGI
jgi:hypothetical protein